MPKISFFLEPPCYLMTNCSAKRPQQFCPKPYKSTVIVVRSTLPQVNLRNNMCFTPRWSKVWIAISMESIIYATIFVCSRSIECTLHPIIQQKSILCCYRLPQRQSHLSYKGCCATRPAKLLSRADESGSLNPGNSDKFHSRRDLPSLDPVKNIFTS
jgi:hypothetical protein